MLEKTIKYTDLNGNPQSEVFMFNLNKREATKLIAQYGGDPMQYIQNLISAGSKGMTGIIDMFETIILGAIGQKSEDGRSFVKKPEYVEWFEQTVAYAELFEELLSDPKSMTEFVEGIIPKDVAKAVSQQEVTPQLTAVPNITKALTAEDELKRLMINHPELFKQ